MIVQNLIHLFDKNALLTADMKGEVFEVTTGYSDGASETTGTAAWIRKFVVAHYRHQDLPLRVNQTNDPEILLRNIINGQMFFFTQPLRIGSTMQMTLYPSQPPSS